MTDTRIVYGALCTWWDGIDNVGLLPAGPSGHRLPCCPHCASPLFELPNEDQWWSQVEAHEKAGHPGYRAFIEWLRGRCFGTLASAMATYKAENSSS